MGMQPPTSAGNPSVSLRCPHCHTQLPPRALFCSSCGKQVNTKESQEQGQWTQESDSNAQDQDATIRLSPLSKEHLKRWYMSQSLKNNRTPEQQHKNGPFPQNADALKSSLLETEIPKTEPLIAQTQREAPVPGERLPSLPTTPVPSIQETWQQIPYTEVPASKSSGPNWLWPVIIIISALSAGLVNFVFTGIAIRPIIVFWFLLVCPGMIVMRFLRLKEAIVEWTLALALSFAIDALVAAILLYTGKWSSTNILSILVGLCLVGAIVQAILAQQSHSTHARKRGTQWLFALKHKVGKFATKAAGKRQLSLNSWKPGIVLIFLALLIGSGIFLDFRSNMPNHSDIPKSTIISHPSGPAPDRVSSINPLKDGTYDGIIYDLSSNVKTNLSLTIVRQSQGKMSGYLILGSKLQGSASFSGTIDSAKHFQLTVTDAAGHTMFFFEGEAQTAIDLSGDYYQCNLAQKSQCSRAVSGSYGMWSAVLVS